MTAHLSLNGQPGNNLAFFEANNRQNQNTDFDGFPYNAAIEAMSTEQLETAFNEIKTTNIKPNTFLAKVAVVGFRQHSWEGRHLMLWAIGLYAIELNINPEELKTAQQKANAKLNIISEITPQAMKYLDSEILENDLLLQLDQSFDNWLASKQ